MKSDGDMIEIPQKHYDAAAAGLVPDDGQVAAEQLILNLCEGRRLLRRNRR
jgi:hypothetical protein